MRRPAVLPALAAVLAAVLAACSTGDSGDQPGATGTSAASASSSGATSSATAVNVYEKVTGEPTGAAAKAKPLVYVPDQQGAKVEVIDPTTYQVVERYPVARSPEHVVPSWDLTTLWVNSDEGNTLTPIDPITGKIGTPVPIADPYNLYFTPDGKYAIVMAEALKRIDVRDPKTMELIRSVPVPCAGVNHADFTADGSKMLASCEFDGHLLVLDGGITKVEKSIDLNPISTPGATSPQEARMHGGPKANLSAGANAMPQDVRLTPDGKYFLAADMLRNGVWVIDATTLTQTRFVPTAMGAHGIYPSRDTTQIYVSNRDAGSVTVLDSATLKPAATWTIPGGGSPDMGDVSLDGKEFWLSGRYHNEVYVFDTATGKLTHRIKLGQSPHGLLVWPQPGRYSLGHTGNMR